MFEHSWPVLAAFQFNDFVQPLCHGLRDCRCRGAAFGEVFHPFDGYGEIEILPLREIESCQPHQLAVLIEQSATAGAGRDGGGGLDVVAAFDLAQAGDDAVREREFEALGGADGIDLRTDFERFGAADHDSRGAKARDAEGAYIPIPVGIAQSSRVLLGPDAYLELAGAFDNVAIGHYISVGKYDATTHCMDFLLIADIFHDDRTSCGLFINFVGGLGVDGECHKEEDGSKCGVSKQGAHSLILSSYELD